MSNVRVHPIGNAPAGRAVPIARKTDQSIVGRYLHCFHVAAPSQFVASLPATKISL